MIITHEARRRCPPETIIEFSKLSPYRHCACSEAVKFTYCTNACGQDHPIHYDGASMTIFGTTAKDKKGLLCYF